MAIGGHELHIHRPACAGGRPPVRRAFPDHPAHHVGERGGRQAEVDEARPRNVDLLHHPGHGAQAAHDLLRQLAGIAVQPLGQLERQVGRQVAVRILPRAFQPHLGVRRAQVTGHGDQRLPQPLGPHVQCSSPVFLGAGLSLLASFGSGALSSRLP
jgi:hypothetical protein